MVAATTFVLALAGCSHPARLPALLQPGGDLVIRHATVVDTRDGHLSPGMTLTIRAGRITAVEADTQSSAGQTGAEIDAAGRFLIPGFVDAHTHVIGSPEAANDEALMLANGVTGMRQMSGSEALLQTRRENRLFASPFAPALLAMPGDVLITTNAFTPKDAVSEVDRQKAQGADFIKVALVPPAAFYAVAAEARKVGLPFAGHLPPGVDPVQAVQAGYKSIEHLGPGIAMLEDCSTQESELKQEVAAHPMKKPPPLPGFLVEAVIRRITRNTLLGEIFFDAQTIPHMQRIVDTFAETKCQKLAAAIAASGSWQVPTLIKTHSADFGDDLRYLNDPDLKYVAASIRKDREAAAHDLTKRLSPTDRATVASYWGLELKLARILDQAGVPMLTGTDSAGGAAGFNLHKEFALLAQDGFAPLKILQMATLNAATFFGHESTMGTVEVGRDANLILLDANPIESSGNLDRIAAVVRNGIYYSRQDVDKKLAVIEREAATR